MALAWMAGCDATSTADLNVAVASNFAPTLEVIAARFEDRTGLTVTLSPGSTGKHYAQIVHGAPFDLFLAADADRPQRLEAEGLAVSGSRFTYAIGQLVLWSPDPDVVDELGAVLATGEFRYLALANPDLAPYGSAAREVLAALGLWSALESRMVRGENVTQAFQFVRSGNAQLGFVALSQLRQGGSEFGGSRWRIPRALYRPIDQQAVLLRESSAGRAFLAFMRSEEALQLITEYGYLRP
jgi:molybdate transport system substrate-binding protein